MQHDRRLGLSQRRLIGADGFGFPSRHLAKVGKQLIWMALLGVGLCAILHIRASEATYCPGPEGGCGTPKRIEGVPPLDISYLCTYTGAVGLRVHDAVSEESTWLEYDTEPY